MQRYPTICRFIPPQHHILKTLYVRDQVSQPYKTRGKIKVLRNLILRFLTADEKKKGSGLNDNNVQ
jgi:hypothetical protein